MFGTFLPAATHTCGNRINSQTVIYTLGSFDLINFPPSAAKFRFSRTRPRWALRGRCRRSARRDCSANEGRANEVLRKDAQNIWLLALDSARGPNQLFMLSDGDAAWLGFCFHVCVFISTVSAILPHFPG